METEANRAPTKANTENMANMIEKQFIKRAAPVVTSLGLNEHLLQIQPPSQMSTYFKT